jgi:hypothetical protein
MTGDGIVAARARAMAVLTALHNEYHNQQYSVAPIRGAGRPPQVGASVILGACCARFTLEILNVTDLAVFGTGSASRASEHAESTGRISRVIRFCARTRNLLALSP